MRSGSRLSIERQRELICVIATGVWDQRADHATQVTTAYTSRLLAKPLLEIVVPMRLYQCAAVLMSFIASGTAVAQAAQLASNGSNQTYFEFQVEKPVSSRPGNPHAQYPNDDRVRAKGGAVTAQFVVDTTGRVDLGTFTVVKATDEASTNSVRRVLPEMRFYPAEEGGRKVRQLVEQDFRFPPAQQ